MFLQKWSKPLTMAALLVSSSLYAASNPAVEAKNGMVVTSQHLASQVGVDILKLGGNAIDAAVAVGYAQAVVNPCCGNIGGGGFMTVHLADGTDTFINFRETAPAAASANMYLDAAGNVKKGASLYGYLAAGVPGTVLGMETARKKYGKLSREQVMEPAIKLAREGFVLTRADTDILDTTIARFKQDAESARIFLRPDGTPLQPGDRLVQSDLANTLAAIAKDGPDAFYKGKIPQAVEAAAKQGGGILTAADFANYKVTETPPITCSYRGYKFVSAPPPSSGGVTLCEILNVVEGYDLKNMGFNSAAAIHTMTEAMRHAYMDRNTYLGDPEFIKNPIDRLVSKSYAEEIRKKIVADKATPSENVQPGMEPHEKPETTHYSIVDHQGNAVSTTYTVNGRFGAVVIAPGTGFFLNDEMDDFTVKVGEKNLYGLVQGTANSIAPGKRPLSSMSPTLVTKDNKIFMVLGSPGGSRIITITLQTALNVIDHGMAPQEAVDAPRIHHQWLPDEVYYEQRGVSADTLKILSGMGYKMVEQTPWGAAELILVGLPGAAGVSPANSGNDSAVSGKVREGYLYGANDVRRPAGSAVGY
ncbi:gamma-glutamyltransferase [Serratia proteamaculans]|jgi:gamma-glutamyltranspeptidase/glutathione hydrolase|uniref:gamma-glutamyltransferase n=1 Tax=Serratia proteamaculans TaxID=28151 RepID=UPI0015A4DF7B|nr:gamma-glutamyltransferase [Serratia proteamaculans]NWA70458.1 gamma-glutamyltransferase [Serratia proteamaculans]CAI0890505.1 Gamma-glutamyltranspeptidase precursor [Serratia proteamaculans]CAI0989822.1 Gamma-glutamyltranspeptidase precursor [Serratia proteamaculans]CAI1074328.1 Gamma-glutamyltranspeptidase precursor [Serratia proteamaculans]CAI1794168.1 Gamma-glutamyltranspeptidase precursor [Serratia proteamaculans]